MAPKTPKDKVQTLYSMTQKSVNFPPHLISPSLTSYIPTLPIPHIHSPQALSSPYFRSRCPECPSPELSAQSPNPLGDSSVISSWMPPLTLSHLGCSGYSSLPPKHQHLPI